MPKPERGRIVEAEVVDPQGRNRKPRPVAILVVDETQADPDIGVVCITSTFPNPLPDECVALPWDRRGHRQTGLRVPSVAVCNWLAVIQESDILSYRGRVPDSQMLDIERKVNALQE